MTKSRILVNLFVVVTVTAAGLSAAVHSFRSVEAGANITAVSVLSKHLIIDAGHGDFDGGTTGVNGILEKDINLDISNKTAAIASLAGFSVITVREDDTALNDPSLKTIRQKKISDMHARLALTEEYPDSIYLGIHQNHYPRETIHGAQVFYGTESTESRRLAELLQKRISSELQPDNHRKIKEAHKELYLLTHAKVPAIMLECGFLSNKDECDMLCDYHYQQELAFTTVSALLESF